MVYIPNNKNDDIIGTSMRGCDIIAFDEESWQRDKRRVENGEIKYARKRYLCRCHYCGQIKSIALSELKKIPRKNRDSEEIGCGCRRKIHQRQSALKSNNYYYNSQLCCYVGSDCNGNEFLISPESYDAVLSHCWTLDGRYFRSKIDKSKSAVLLHRYIMFGDNADKHSEYVDHINGDTHDCRISNLRSCNKSQNMMNRKIRKDNTSGVTGVTYCKPNGQWRVRLDRDHETMFYQAYDTFEDAVSARKLAEEKYFGKYSVSASRGSKQS